MNCSFLQNEHAFCTLRKESYCETPFAQVAFNLLVLRLLPYLVLQHLDPP